VRIELAAEVFVDAAALPHVLNLLKCVAEGRHDWEADPSVADTAHDYLQEHCPRLATTFAMLGRKGLVAAAWRGAADSTIRVEINAADLVDLAADLSRPAVLVVENHVSDGSFVRAVARAFRADRIHHALRERWLEIDHGGGETLVGVAEEAAYGFRRLTRVAVVLDSDRMTPSRRTRAHDKADRLAKSGIVVHVLELREAENYVPNRVLAATGKGAIRRLQLLRHLTPAQRGHFDMKEGFGPANGPPVVRPEQLALYADVDQRVLNGLRGGLGRDLLQQMETMSESLHERDFASLGTDVPDELRRMLDSLTSVI
jgi:hypothetical protein